jgi:hypothetical protein
MVKVMLEKFGIGQNNMGIIVYTKDNPKIRRRVGKDLFKEVRKLRKINKFLIISNLILIIYFNKDIIFNYIKEFYGKMV